MKLTKIYLEKNAKGLKYQQRSQFKSSADKSMSYS